MNKGLILGVIVLAVLATSLWFLVKDDGGTTLINDVQKGVEIYVKSQTPMPTTQPSPQAIPAEFQSGKSRFSQGTCSSGSDCKPGGCSGEVCSSSGDVVSTCEYSESFPNVQGYQCVCLQTKVCGWR